MFCIGKIKNEKSYGKFFTILGDIKQGIIK
jgi:hypothetical protein